jgi:hypothetical protein
MMIAAGVLDVKSHWDPGQRGHSAAPPRHLGAELPPLALVIDQPEADAERICRQRRGLVRAMARR